MGGWMDVITRVWMTYVEPVGGGIAWGIGN